MSRRVCVIGAGASGLTTIKGCLEEGLEPTCFESSDDIGGLWRFKETPEPGRASIYRSLVVNTSKEMMCFSDFPMPPEYPNYMTHSQLLQYFRLYAQHFDLLRHIIFRTSVQSVRQQPDFSHSGQWEVVTKHRDGREDTHIFDGVLVCSGHFTHPFLPLAQFPGHESFPGRCLHSWEYKDAEAFRGKRVVVIGIGNSGGDIAVEISRAAEKTFLSTREGSWVAARMSSNGLPLDMKVLTRFVAVLPRWLLNWLAHRTLNKRFDHRLYGLQPSDRSMDQRLLINDDLPGRILQGGIVMKPNLTEFKGSGLQFQDGTIEEDIDAVIFCTGYRSNFPFLPQSLWSGPEGELTLYRRVFPPSLECPTLAVIGMFQSKGPIFPGMEMQVRWAARVMAGLNQLPPPEKMLSIIEMERKRNMKRYQCPIQAALKVDWIPYLDSMAKEIGVRPNLAWLLLTEPGLGLRVLFGPCTPYQYRLRGPGQWDGARQAILTQWERVAQPFKTRLVPEPDPDRPWALLSPWLITLGGAAVLLVVVLSQCQLNCSLHDTLQQGFPTFLGMKATCKK
ncbi:si:dkey-239i20.4 isoform X1 [Esox lucius]|uniref:Flavin-containing monooxygenase n=2 Tax=Esox lucius TaxID=8010 RepID=A0AAY5L5P1_ESOLU|nr:si:dkey-239i20.4 isoform X1 [Esox lucius]